MTGHRSRLPLVLLAAATAACSSVHYDLGQLPFPVSASPVRGDAAGDRFVLHEKHVLWVHGLAGESQPDVQGQLLANLLPCAGIADFRVSTGASFHDWLVTHLSLGFVRMKTVTVTGVRIRPHS
jgi:hypothetical protein